MEKILQEILEILDYENEYSSIGIDDYKDMLKDIKKIVVRELNIN